MLSQSLIPAILGCKVNTLERDMLAPPLGYGGLGVQNPTRTSDREYDASKKIIEKTYGIDH